MTEPNIDKHEVRFKGVITLDAEAQAALSLNGLAFMVVAVNVSELGAMRMMKDEVVRKDVVDVTDARVMLNGLREQAIEFLAGRPQLEEAFVNLPEVTRVEVPPHDPDAVLVQRVQEVNVNDLPDWAVEHNEVQNDRSNVVEVNEQGSDLGNIYDYKKNYKPDSPSGGDAGPKVAKFSDDSFSSAGVGEREQVGSIRDNKPRKDSVLAKFMEGQ